MVFVKTYYIYFIINSKSKKNELSDKRRDVRNRYPGTSITISRLIYRKGRNGLRILEKDKDTVFFRLCPFISFRRRGMEIYASGSSIGEDDIVQLLLSKMIKLKDFIDRS